MSMENCQTWNRLTSGEIFITGEIGNGGTQINSTVYSRGFFNTGMDCQANNYGEIVIGNNFTDYLTVNMLTRYDSYSVTNGDPSNGTDNNIITLRDTSWGSNGYLYLTHRAGANNTRLVFSSDTGVTMQAFMTTGLDIAVNDYVFWQIIYDNDQTPDGNKVTLNYRNITSGQTLSSIATIVSGTPGSLGYTANQYIKLGQAPTTDATFQSVIDNIKIYNTVESDFSNDISNEGFGGAKKKRGR